MIDILLAAVLATYHPPTVVLALQDDGYGKCPAFYHPHDGDDRCFDNDDNPQVEHGLVLPVPDFNLYRSLGSHGEQTSTLEF